MFSVDNFYSVLQNNLLKPLKIQSYYFYPFGTFNLAKAVYQTSRSHNHGSSHVIFWDQEPINSDLLSSIIKENAADLPNHNSLIIANSDWCEEILNSNMLNWNYFFHGFASLDWFHDLYYLNEHKSTFDKVFITVNRLVSEDRSYRLGLVADIMSRGLESKGLISCAHVNNWKSEIFNSASKLSTNHRKLVLQVFSKLPKNLILDQDEVPGHSSALINQPQIDLFARAFVHIVTETMYYPKKLHLTEKIFRPIVFKRPFILAGCAGNLSYLKRYGFETFSRWWDESYDTEVDNELRLTKIVDTIERLSKYSMSDLQDMYHEMLPVIEHNYQHFYGKFKQIIVDEMLDNFIICLDQHNSNNKIIHDYSILNIPNIKKMWIK